MIIYLPTFPVPLNNAATTKKPTIAVPKLNHMAPLSPLKYARFPMLPSPVTADGPDSFDSCMAT